MIDFAGKYTKIIDVTASGKRSDYTKLYRSFLKIANQTTDIEFDEAVDLVRLIAKTRLDETNLKEARICFVDELPNGTHGMFDGSSWQVFLPDTIFQRLSRGKNGKLLQPKARIINFIKDANTVAHEIDHLQYESYLQGRYALGIKKRLSKEEYRSNRLECLKEGILKFKGKHFKSISYMENKDFNDMFYRIKFGKYFTSRYETRARTSALEYTNNLLLGTKQFISTHPFDAITLGAAFMTGRYNYSMGNFLQTANSVLRDARMQEDIDMSESMFAIAPHQPIIAAVTQYQQAYFSSIQDSEARIIELYSKVSSQTATPFEVKEYNEMLAERSLFEDTFALVQNEEMAHEIAMMPGVNPALKATTLLYSNASISKEEVATIYRDEKYYREHPELAIPSNLSETPENFTEYNQSEISFIRHSVYSEEPLSE